METHLCVSFLSPYLLFKRKSTAGIQDIWAYSPHYTKKSVLKPSSYSTMLSTGEPIRSNPHCKCVCFHKLNTWHLAPLTFYTCVYIFAGCIINHSLILHLFNQFTKTYWALRIATLWLFTMAPLHFKESWRVLLLLYACFVSFLSPWWDKRIEPLATYCFLFLH